jgi:CheY-like chemotaxis protein
MMLAVDSLEEVGFKVETAGSAADALSRFSGRIDAAVVDLGLPDRPGDQLVAELRALRADLPIVIASGYGGNAMPAGFADDPRITVVSKPYTGAQLAGALSDLGLVVAPSPIP